MGNAVVGVAIHPNSETSPAPFEAVVPVEKPAEDGTYSRRSAPVLRRKEPPSETGKTRRQKNRGASSTV